jgi:hypothetical protein
MPYWDLRKIALAFIPVALVAALIAGGYLAKNGGKLGSDEIMASWFCLGAPLILLTIAAVFAIISNRGKHSGQDGYCPRCGEWLRGSDLYCPQCGASAAGWAISPGMKSDRARGQSPERPVSRRRRQHVSIQIANEVTLAAQFIVEQSQAEPTQTADLTAECLTDPEVTRRLYHAAARRLHPDGNEGVQSDAWNHLQEAMEILKQHHEIE